MLTDWGKDSSRLRDGKWMGTLGSLKQNLANSLGKGSNLKPMGRNIILAETYFAYCVFCYGCHNGDESYTFTGIVNIYKNINMYLNLEFKGL